MTRQESKLWRKIFINVFGWESGNMALAQQEADEAIRRYRQSEQVLK